MELYNPGSGMNIHYRIVIFISFPVSNFTKQELNFPKQVLNNINFTPIPWNY